MVDVGYCHGTNTRKTYSFTGIQVHRMSTGIPASSVHWGAYMGSRYDGIFRKRYPQLIFTFPLVATER